MNEQIFLNGAPVIGFGSSGVDAPPAAVVATGLPWGEFVASGVVTSLVGLAVEETVRAVRKKRR